MSTLAVSTSRRKFIVRAVRVILVRLVGTVGTTGKSFALRFHVAYAKAGCAECHSWDKWTDFISDVVEKDVFRKALASESKS